MCIQKNIWSFKSRKGEKEDGKGRGNGNDDKEDVRPSGPGLGKAMQAMSSGVLGNWARVVKVLGARAVAGDTGQPGGEEGGRRGRRRRRGGGHGAA